MKKLQQNLSNFKRGDFAIVSGKIVLNEIIENKDFSSFYFEHVEFSNCNLRDISFNESKSCSLIFRNCQFNSISFAKADLIDIIFQNCQFVNCSFRVSQ